jgi:hypothetical protein
VPRVPFAYLPTRQPVVLDWWKSPGEPARRSGARLVFTTVGNWRQTDRNVEWQGRTLGWSKDERFALVLGLPDRSRHRFELALSGVDASALVRLAAHGWHVLDAVALTKDVVSYRDYVRASSAEFTVAKEQNVRLRSGWFSDRSACYLAAGRPVVTEDTAFGAVLPTGRGLFAFRTLDEAAAAVDAIASDYGSHSRAAVEIAAAHFRAETVVADLLRRAGAAA